MDAAEHEAEVLGERARRVARLTSDRGWFAMVDRLWLDEGDNPTPLGTVVVEGAELRLRGAEGGTVPLRDGDVFEHGGRRYEVGHGGTRPSLRVWDPAAPARGGFRGLAYFPVSLAWRAVARFVPLDPPQVIAMPFSSGDVGDREAPGALELELAGQPVRLLPVIEAEPRPRLLILFADPTNRDETYGAGRLLYAPMPVDGTTILDFNKALNPACAFNELVVCPLPPRENRLPMRVEAGEKRYVS